MSVFFIGTLHAKPEHVENLIASLGGLKDAKGYVSNKVYRDIEDKNKIISVEEWEAKTDHENFVSGFSPEEMEKWMGMLSEKPQGSFFEQA